MRSVGADRERCVEVCERGIEVAERSMHDASIREDVAVFLRDLDCAVELSELALVIGGTDRPIDELSRHAIPLFARKTRDVDTSFELFVAEWRGEAWEALPQLADSRQLHGPVGAP